MLRRIGLTILTVLLSIPAFAQIEAPVTDLALIWIGGRHRPDWNKELFTPYLVHEFPDGHKSWVFDGFLMLEGVTNGARDPQEDYDTYLKRLFSFGEVKTIELAHKDMWIWLLDRQLGTYDGLGCRALDDRIGELIPELGEPATKHKVYLMTPIPFHCDQWGEIDGYKPDFTRFDDKVLAMKWYVDLMIEKFAAADFKNIELEGIYWLRESITDSGYEVECAKAMCEYAHSKGLTASWIPYYRAPHIADGKSYGFDIVLHQPNYVFDLSTPKERLINAIADSWTYDIGMLLEFEGTCIDGIDDGITDTRKVVMQGNSSMYSVNKVLYDRFLAYVDNFEDEGIFDFKPIGYYAGYQAVYDFVNSTDPKDQEIINRVMTFIEDRHIANEWYTPKPAGISEVLDDNRATVYAVDGGIYISNVAQGKVEIFTLEGLPVNMNAGVDDSFKYGATVSCAPGIYIVRAGDAAVKVAVR